MTKITHFYLVLYHFDKIKGKHIRLSDPFVMVSHFYRVAHNDYHCQLLDLVFTCDERHNSYHDGVFNMDRGSD
jgi:hypothetical protein